MNRLTEKFMDKVVLPNIPMEIKNKKDLEEYHEVRRNIENKIIKLAAYEDTGLEPKDVLTATELVNIDVALKKANYALDELKEYKDLEEQGLLIKLPCKVDSVVYAIKDGEIKVIRCDYTDGYGFVEVNGYTDDIDWELQNRFF
jgi:hypothetical protein